MMEFKFVNRMRSRSFRAITVIAGLVPLVMFLGAGVSSAEGRSASGRTVVGIELEQLPVDLAAGWYRFEVNALTGQWPPGDKVRLFVKVSDSSGRVIASDDTSCGENNRTGFCTYPSFMHSFDSAEFDNDICARAVVMIGGISEEAVECVQIAPTAWRSS
ncbi:hypothetical protein [Nocardia transvalensis]|uniref:hypothetical protein n=1 Tax=Nocardia transvalensis TaxID=37333 RepID=UPI0018940BBC|nr:hypothetical protein [Nocardia transvalensis]MBF6327471.1 hypothetical protein [Nocardia transvalensis]